MASRTVIQFSPTKPSLSPSSTPQRAKRPSREKTSLTYTTILTSSERTAPSDEDNSLTKKLKGAKGKALTQSLQFDTVLGTADPQLNQALKESKRIELSHSLIYNGRAEGPRDGNWRELAGLFPTTFEVQISPPVVVIRVREVPEKPWPLTIGGLPVFFTSHKTLQPFNRGQIGKGKKILEELDLSETANVSDKVLRQVTDTVIDTIGKILDIFWWAGCWTITVPDETKLESLPRRIAGAPAFYKHKTNQSVPNPLALRNKPPGGVEYDDTIYDTGPNALLRPGVMLSSSAWLDEKDGMKSEQFLSTSSGVLVTDKLGNKFVTVASRGFRDDGHVWHPTPRTGRLIGRVVEKLSDCDISIVEFRPGLSYVNTTFGTPEAPQGLDIKDVSTAEPPDLKLLDFVFMDNPFTGRCEGLVLGTGFQIEDGPERDYVPCRWIYFENGNEPVDGSCGSPIWDKDGKLVAFFRFQNIADVTMTLATAATRLENHGYSLYRERHTFTEQ